MSIVELTLKNKLIAVVAMFIILGGGYMAYSSMPRFEDPEFTIRTAQIFTSYPGASPLEVAEQVTSPLEEAIQQMEEVESISSTSSDGVSEIKVDIKYEMSKSDAELDIIYTRLRSKIADAQSSLPRGAGKPIVNDDFGDVYGLLYHVTGEGYTDAELNNYVEQLQKELLQVEGVAKVGIIGDQKEAIFVEISQSDAVALGVSMKNIFDRLEHQNAMVSSGDVKTGQYRIQIDPTRQIDSVEAIQNLLVTTQENRNIYLRDIAHVYRGYVAPATRRVSFNGESAIIVGVSAVSGSNVVKVGQAIDEKLQQEQSRRPIGIEVHEYYHQGKVVDQSVQDFVLNVVVALIIVIVTLLIFMGPSSAMVIGGVLLMTVFSTVLTMELAGIPMHRISLGALIIALGMMVDNAIVVTEGILIGVKRGKDKRKIASEVVSKTKWPLLGGTLVGILAFAPIGFAPGSTAEYTGDLFWVVMISLLYSWIFAITLTPLYCVWLFRQKKQNQADQIEEKIGVFAQYYMTFMRGTLKARWVVLIVVIGMFVTAIWGWRFVKSGFFPASTTPQIVVDYWLPQGTDIDATRADIKGIEEFASELDGVVAVQSTTGSGNLRYMLVYDGESPNSAYGQILIKVNDYNKIDNLLPKIQKHIDERYPQSDTKVWRFVLGPGGGSKIEATFKGPDPGKLRAYADQAKKIMAEDGRALSIKDDWRQPVMVMQPRYSEERGSWTGVTSEDLKGALRRNYSGDTVGHFREGDDLIPIISRAPSSEREGLNDMGSIQVMSSGTGHYIPIEEVTDGYEMIWRNGKIRSEDRQWTIKAQSDNYPDELASDLLKRIRPKIEAIPLEDGYTLEWDGEEGNSKEANEDLMSVVPYGLGAMILVVLFLFRKIRQTLVVFLIVPLAIIGVAIGLILMQLPLEFMAILGLLSLSGLLIKNAIVLVDEIDLNIREGMPRFDAVVVSATSRVRPVMMGTLTTVLGVIPLYTDAFFKAMSVTLVFGLSFATLLTLIVAPVLYAIFFRIRSEEIEHAKA